MRLLQPIASMLLLTGLLCHAAQVGSLEATQYLPLIALDYQAMTTFAAGSPASQAAPAAIQNVSGFPKDLPSHSAAR